MSNQLAISATLSVLMMSVFVLFGPSPEQEPATFESSLSEASATLPALPLPALPLPALPLPALSANPGHLLPILR